MFVPRIRYTRLSTDLSTMAGSSVERRLVRKLGMHVVLVDWRRLTCDRLLYFGRSYNVVRVWLLLRHDRCIAVQRTSLTTLVGAANDHCSPAY